MSLYFAAYCRNIRFGLGLILLKEEFRAKDMLRESYHLCCLSSKKSDQPDNCRLGHPQYTNLPGGFVFFTIGVKFGRIVMIPEEEMSMLLQSISMVANKETKKNQREIYFEKRFYSFPTTTNGQTR